MGPASQIQTHLLSMLYYDCTSASHIQPFHFICIHIVPVAKYFEYNFQVALVPVHSKALIFQLFLYI